MWARIAIRAIAIANVGLVFLGALYIERAPSGLSILEKVARSNPVAHAEGIAHLRLLFYVLTTVNILFLTALLVCSVLIWRCRPMGRRLSTIVFASEIVYWFCWFRVSEFVLLRWGGDAGDSLVGSLATIDGLGNSGLATQFDIWYPVVALVALNLLYHQLGRMSMTRSPKTAQM